MASQIISIRRGSIAAADSADNVEAILAAIRAGQASELKAMLNQLEDRLRFFAAHYDAMANTVQDCQSEEVLLVLLKLGYPTKGEFIDLIYRKGSQEALKLLEEHMDKSKSRERWERDEKYFKNKYGYKIVSL